MMHSKEDEKRDERNGIKEKSLTGQEGKCIRNKTRELKRHEKRRRNNQKMGNFNKEEIQPLFRKLISMKKEQKREK